MKGSPAKNIPASVRARLLRLSTENKQDFQILLGQYAIERLLYRLSKSRHAKSFVLKGAMLFAIWCQKPTRSTRDLDLLGFGDISLESLIETFRSVCNMTVELDGLVFDSGNITVEKIREDNIYGGIRVNISVFLDKARIPLQVDVGLGDSVIPPPEDTSFPSLLGYPAPKVRSYAKETVIAEKLEAAVKLGMDNSRMKDFYDIWFLSRQFSFNRERLLSAIRATFERRETGLPAELPVAFTPRFFGQTEKARQWTGFIKRAKVDDPALMLEDVIRDLIPFILPLLAPKEAKQQLFWTPPGPWK